MSGFMFRLVGDVTGLSISFLLHATISRSNLDLCVVTYMSTEIVPFVFEVCFENRLETKV